MKSTESHLTPTEWSLMECLWEHSPRTGKEAVNYMAQSLGWSRSTTLTMLRRMTEKGYIICQTADGINTYSPLLAKEAVTLEQTREFLDRVYKGSISMLLSAFTQKQSLSQAEIDQLHAILEEAQNHD